VGSRDRQNPPEGLINGRSPDWLKFKNPLAAAGVRCALLTFASQVICVKATLHENSFDALCVIWICQMISGINHWLYDFRPIMKKPSVMHVCLLATRMHIHSGHQ